VSGTRIDPIMVEKKKPMIAARQGMRPIEGAVRLLGHALCVLAIGLLVSAPATAAELDVKMTYLGKSEPPRIPLSLVEPILEDEGLLGARQGIKDNQTTGRFLKHNYELVERIVPEDGDLDATFKEALAAGERLFVADLEAEDLVALAPLADEAGAILFNSRAQDDRLRTEQCFASVFHTASSRAMKTDALAQYLVWKRWLNWFLIYGSHPEDQLLAEAYRRSARKFGAKIVEERLYEDTGGARRTDTGHVQVQTQMPVFTQAAPEHDVIIAADEADVFAEYLSYRTWDPRPIAGSAGLVPSNWSRVHEQWGGTQLQTRFERDFGRTMTDRDYNAWTAVRSVGEAVTRAQTSDPAELHAYMLSDSFELGAFKGQALTYRPWNQQLRQPILLVTPRMLVSVSPQDQFLHQRTPLDTLGFDEPESQCRLNG
jgi:ABC transporter substrate binding protein (PQQ-dependent alcohol dehydrogenase system)